MTNENPDIVENVKKDQIDAKIEKKGCLGCLGLIVLAFIIGYFTNGTDKETEETIDISDPFIAKKIENIKDELIKSGYTIKKDDDKSLFFVTQKSNTYYRAEIFYEEDLNGMVGYMSNAAKPSNHSAMWQAIKHVTVNDERVNKSVSLLLVLTRNKIDLQDLLKEIDNYSFKNKPPAKGSGVYHLRIDKDDCFIHLKAHWWDGRLIIDYNFNRV